MYLDFQVLKKIAISAALYVVLVSCSSCSGGGSTPNPPNEPTEIIPTNLALTIDVVGADANHPNGDGSGVIHCTATATNATTYGFRFGNGIEVASATGQVVHTYTNEGTYNYTVYVYAYSSTGNSINVSKEVTITVTPTSYSTLVFSDEFDTPGAPDSSKWGYDIGSGGWGNNESEYYTNRASNVIIEGGLLKITAKKESYQGAEYTSTRIKTQGKYDFTYGKVEVRAKLPAGGGTWPAIWMLGSNITSVGWPASGEIDIMEHIGNDLGRIHGSIHTPSSFGSTVNTSTKLVSDVSTAFHVYGVTWSPEAIEFTIDEVVFYTYNPSTKNSNTWPFDANQFIILNVAMGGNFGGTIDPNFSSATMEIDYVRIYQ